MTFEIVPVTFKDAKAFVAEHHRHHKPSVGMRLCVGLSNASGQLVGVAIAGNPKARMLQDGRTLEVTRSCTDGTRNANSALYGAIWRAARAIGYRRCITYTQEGETGASLRAAGWIAVKEIPPSKGWDRPSRARADHGVDGHRPHSMGDKPMSGYHPPAWLVEAHKEARCPDACPLCVRIESAQDRPEPEVFWSVEGNYHEEWRDVP